MLKCRDIEKQMMLLTFVISSKLFNMALNANKANLFDILRFIIQFKIFTNDLKFPACKIKTMH